jgi:hypothetical protein
VVRLFPEHDPVRFDGLAVPRERLADRGSRRTRDEPAWRLLEGPYVRRAHITVTTIKPSLGDTRSAGWLTVNDTPVGRFLIFPLGDQIAVTPGKRVTFENKIKEMIGPNIPY